MNRIILDHTMDDQKYVQDLRREYMKKSLSEDEVADNPVKQFALWFREALAADLPDANAMTLATASAEGKPSARIVLLKGFDENGIHFYTNYQSRKGRELEENPYAALCFYWQGLERQVRIEGSVKKASREDSAAYFKKRPRLSRLGAWASSQSREVESREALEQRFKKVKNRFEGQDIPLPDFWGGFILQPSQIEFWQGRPGRLHDRVLYRKIKTGWEIVRLSP